MVKPITPKEARAQKNGDIPKQVIQAFNELIAENITLSGSASFTKDAVVERILDKDWEGDIVDAQDLHDNRWLDIEEIFAKAGWHVTYEGPGYNESFDAYFKFEPN